MSLNSGFLNAMCRCKISKTWGGLQFPQHELWDQQSSESIWHKPNFASLPRLWAEKSSCRKQEVLCPQEDELLCDSVKQGLFGFLPTARAGREKAKVRETIPPAAVSFPWPNWNHLYIYLFPINVCLSACMQLDILGQAYLLLKGPSLWVVLSIYLIYSNHHTQPLAPIQPVAVKGRLPCSSFSLAIVQISSMVPDLAPFWLHLAPNTWLCLPLAHWRQLLVFNGSACMHYCYASMLPKDSGSESSFDSFHYWALSF